MGFGTFLACGVSFVAGLIVGVVLGDKGVITTEHLHRGGRYIVDSTRSMTDKWRTES